MPKIIYKKTATLILSQKMHTNLKKENKTKRKRKKVNRKNLLTYFGISTYWIAWMKALVAAPVSSAVKPATMILPSVSLPIIH